MAGLWRDMRLGFRSLLKSPGFTLVALVTLALGIGANTAIFSVVDAVVLHPLPYPKAGRIVAVHTTDRNSKSSNGTLTYDLYRDYRSHANLLDPVAAYAPWPFTITHPGQTSTVLGVDATPSLFAMLGARPLQGRTFTAADAQSDRPVAVISEKLWRKRFHSRPSAIGATIELDHHPYTVVGVLPASVRFPMLPGVPDIWVPLSRQGLAQMFGSIISSLNNAFPGQSGPKMTAGNIDVLSVIGRLKPGATLAQAQAQASVLVAGFVRAHPAGNRGTGLRVSFLAQGLEKGYRTALLLLLGAVGLVLLVACANVANLLLARATTRERETALRLALGAGKGGMVRMALVESAELALAGGLLGAYLAYLTVSNLHRWLPPSLARVAGDTLNGHVLLFTAAVSLAAGLLFGSFPLWGLADMRVFEKLKEGGRGSGGAGSGRRLRDALAVAEVAMAVVLLAGSGLLLHSFLLVLAVNPGYDPHGVLLTQVNLPTRDYSTPAQWRNFLDAGARRLRSMPGVSEVAAAVTPPVAQEHIGLNATYDVVGHPLPPDQQPTAQLLPVTPGYFQLMRTPLLAGRDFTRADQPGSTRVCVVNQVLAREQFGGKSPIGSRILFSKLGQTWQIIGVVGNEHQGSLQIAPKAAIFVPFAQFPFPDFGLLVRTPLAAASLGPSIRNAIHDVGPDVPVNLINPLEQLLARTRAGERFRTLLVGLFAGLAILLAAVGISGVLGYSVSRRRQEIGLRLALGATPSVVLRQVVGEGLRLVGIGAAIGLGAALGLTRLMRSLLYGVGPADPLTYTGVAVLLLVVALLACALPALRASRIDPNVALRYE